MPRRSEARDHRHVTLRSSLVSHRVVQHQRGKEVDVGLLGALVDRSPTKVVLSSAWERVVKLEAALAALRDVGGPDHSAPEFVEECKTSSTGARSGCPVEPVRAIRWPGLRRGWQCTTRRGSFWFQSCRKEKVLARLREAATVARDVSVPQPVQPDAGVQVARLEGDGEGSAR